MDFTPLLLSVKLATITTAILFVISLPLSWFLSQTKSKLKPILETITALPIVLPPSVLGFYLLVVFSPNSLISQLFGIDILFSWSGIVVASLIYSFPFMVQPLQKGFEALNREMIEVSYICGKGYWETLFRVALPNIRPSLISAIVITFAHTIGEFGVILMVGGGISEETKVASIAIYEFVEMMDYNSAHIYSGILLFVSFATLLSLHIFQRHDKY
ncbi:MAG TPA: molybdate ABC transporter permease subunit [Campylobacterales bacterium]|nr:molybdate ABC transporter permease subunit [Campylobacterales bacterium]